MSSPSSKRPSRLPDIGRIALAKKQRTLSIRAGLAGFCLMTALSACSDPEDTAPFAPACPGLDIPGNAADNVRYDGKGLDIGHLVTHTKLLAVRGDCREGPKDSRKRPLTRVRVSLELLQQYGPAYKGKPSSHSDSSKMLQNNDPLSVAYFVAVTRDGEIVDKKLFEVKLPKPVDSISRKISTPLRFIDIPTGPNPQTSPYTLEVGLQLTHQELDYNRTHLTPASFRERIPSAVEIEP